MVGVVAVVSVVAVVAVVGVVAVLPKCVENLHLDICNKEDELDELYDKVHEAEEDLATMRHKRSLMKIYVKKLKEMDDDNITLADLLHVICTDVVNDNYKEYFNVIKNIKVDDIGESKKELYPVVSVFILVPAFAIMAKTILCFWLFKTK